MAKEKRPKAAPQVPRRKAPAETSQPQQRKRPHLSDEFIVDSDNESPATARGKGGRPKKAIATSTATKAKEPMKQVNSTVSSIVQSSSSASSDDEDDENDPDRSSDDSRSRGTDPPKESNTKNGTLRTANQEKRESVQPLRDKGNTSEDDSSGTEGDTSGSEGSSGSDESAGTDSSAPENATSQTSPKHRAESNGLKRKAADQSISGSDDDDTSDGNDGDTPRSKRSRHESNHDSTPRTQNPLPTEGVRRTATKPFHPPSGFSLVDTGAQKSASGILPGDLEQASIWHITAPVGVPLSTVKTLTAEAIEGSEPVLSYKGVDYVLQSGPDVPGSSEFVVLPGQQQDGKAAALVSRHLHLQQRIVLPNLSRSQASTTTGSDAAADVSRASVTSIRPQPKGLRMRYKPPGFGPGRPGITGSDSDSDINDGQPESHSAMQFPSAVGMHSGSSGTAGEKVKSSKKRNHGEDDVLSNGLNTPKAQRSNPKDTLMTNGTKSKEHKARRKEEKRLNKEAKKAKTS